METTTNNLSTQYSALEQDLDSVSATVASHTSQISKKADTSTVTTVTDKVTSLESNLEGFQTTVSSTYATKNALDQTNNEVSMLYGDPTNYSCLNNKTATQLGFTFSDDNWYIPKVLQRDTKLSTTLYECFGGERILVEYEYSSSVKGKIEIGGTESGYANVGVGVE